MSYRIHSFHLTDLGSFRQVCFLIFISNRKTKKVFISDERHLNPYLV